MRPVQPGCVEAALRRQGEGIKAHPCPLFVTGQGRGTCQAESSSSRTGNQVLARGPHHSRTVAEVRPSSTHPGRAKLGRQGSCALRSTRVDSLVCRQAHRDQRQPLGTSFGQDRCRSHRSAGERRGRGPRRRPTRRDRVNRSAGNWKRGHNLKSRSHRGRDEMKGRRTS